MQKFWSIKIFIESLKILNSRIQMRPIIAREFQTLLINRKGSIYVFKHFSDKTIKSFESINFLLYLLLHKI